MSKTKHHASRGHRTPLFSELRKIVRMARISHTQNMSVNELMDSAAQGMPAKITRRKFLQYGGSMAFGGLTLPSWSLAKTRNLPAIAIVGAGLAGLTAAYELRKKGVPAKLYEASGRTGGRAFTQYGLVAKDSVTELGGEFIDSTHKEIISLTEELGLALLDRKTDENRKVAYFFEGQHYRFEQIVEVFKPLIEQIIAVDDSIDDLIDYQHEANAAQYDKISLAGYLDKLGVRGWLRKFIETAYITEFGLDPEEQSCLNFVFMLVGEEPDELRENFQIFGSSDERFRIAGGVSKLTEKLAGLVGDNLLLEYELVALSRKNQRYRLSFATSGGSIREELADIVILTLPFSVLRDVKMDLDMPPFKRKAINELGYGTNIKIVTSTPKRLWREQGFTGEVFADNPLQLVWDNSENQSFASGGLTFFHGGSSATELMRRTPDKILQTFWPALDKTFPGLRQQGHGKLYMFTWPTYRFSKGSYACYKPGQWTTLAGAEKVPVDRLFFAGEHCSYAHQGMMNGAVESGMQVAETILSRFIGAATG